MKKFVLVSVALMVVSFYNIILAGTVINATDGAAKLTVHVGDGKHRIEPDIYGHFAEHLGRCVYEGFWVGEDSDIPNVRGIRKDVVEALKKLDVPVLRWPGGCFADEYHWKDGIGPRDKRPKMVNTHWGMVTDTNAFGTHEFLDLCEMLGCEAYIAGNMGSGSPEEMQDWVEYMTFDGDSEMANLRRANGREKPWKIKYFGVGNENWGCGGNMTPEYYSDMYKRYQTYVRNYPGSRIIKVACGPNGGDPSWTDSIMKNIGTRMHGFGLHYYVRGTGSWGNGQKGSATNFDETEWFHLMKNTLNINNLIEKNLEIMDKYDSRKRVALYIDEWGTWWDEESGTKGGFLYQQNTLRDAVSASIYLNSFNNNCDRVKMCAIAQINNVLQAMILTDKEKMLVTPTYHVFEMYKVHQGATMLPIDLSCNPYAFDGEKLPGLDASVSKGSSGTIQVTLCNMDPSKPAELECVLEGMKAKSVKGRVLTADAMNVHNTFEKPDTIKPVKFEDVDIQNGKVVAVLPPMSVVVLEVE